LLTLISVAWAVVVVTIYFPVLLRVAVFVAPPVIVYVISALGVPVIVKVTTVFFPCLNTRGVAVTEVTSATGFIVTVCVWV
jgi:hypothetical protein